MALSIPSVDAITLHVPFLHQRTCPDRVDLIVTPSGNPHLCVQNIYLFFVLNIALEVYHIICSLNLQNSTYLSTKSTCLYRSVVDAYV